jgi:hypothetical protein
MNFLSPVSNSRSVEIPHPPSHTTFASPEVGKSCRLRGTGHSRASHLRSVPPLIRSEVIWDMKPAYVAVWISCLTALTVTVPPDVSA